MTTLQIESLDLRRQNNQIKSNDLLDLDVLVLNQIYGGNLPNSEQTAVILAYANTNPSRYLTGAILAGKNVAIDVAVADPGSSGNTVNQRNG
jgi:hypothetical protein